MHHVHHVWFLHEHHIQWIETMVIAADSLRGQHRVSSSVLATWVGLSDCLTVPEISLAPLR